MEAFAAQFDAAEGGGDQRPSGDGTAENPDKPWKAHAAGHGAAGSARSSAADTARAIVGILSGLSPTTEHAQHHIVSPQAQSRRASPAISNSEDDDAEGSDDPDYAPGGYSHARASGNHRRRSSSTSDQRSSFSKSLPRGERPPVFDTKGQLLPKQRKYITVRWWVSFRLLASEFISHWTSANPCRLNLKSPQRVLSVAPPALLGPQTNLRALCRKRVRVHLPKRPAQAGPKIQAKQSHRAAKRGAPAYVFKRFRGHAVIVCGHVEDRVAGPPEEETAELGQPSQPTSPRDTSRPFLAAISLRAACFWRTAVAFASC